MKIFVGENNDADIKATIMDPNTRMLIHVNIGDYENDMDVFQMLRGGSVSDMARRKNEWNKFTITPDMIDT